MNAFYVRFHKTFSMIDFGCIKKGQIHNNYVTHFSFIQAPNEPFNLEMALSIAKNHEHETILYTEQAETISVPVTSIPNSAETFDGYQVIVMPSHEPILDTKSILDSKVMAKFPSAPSEVSTYVHIRL